MGRAGEVPAPDVVPVPLWQDAAQGSVQEDMPPHSPRDRETGLEVRRDGFESSKVNL